jgi:hypothetical protein
MPSLVLPLLQVQLTRYSYCIILILGNIGNIFIVLMFSRRRQNSCLLYLLVAAVFNSITITTSLPIALYGFDYGDPNIHSLTLCKLRSYVVHAWTQISRYLIVLACVDRYVLTTNNVYFRAMNRPSVARYTIGSVIVFWHVASIHILILLTINNGRCGLFGVYYFVYQIYFLIFASLIPAASITVSGSLLYRNLKQLHTRVQPVGNITDRTRVNISVQRRDRELFIMILAEVAVYVMTSFMNPLITFEIALTTYMNTSKSTERLQIENFLSALSIILIYLNSAVPFYTYLAVSRAFRKDFKKLVAKWRCQWLGRVGINDDQGTAHVL